MNAVPGYFTSVPPEPDEERSSGMNSKQTIVGPVRVVGLGAICELGTTSKDGRSQAFNIREFALLDDARRVILHSERGYAIGWGSNVEPPGKLAALDTRESIEQQVLNTVLPDDDECLDPHPWEWLAELARARGVNVTAEDLRILPYEVVLDDTVTRWLDSAEAKGP